MINRIVLFVSIRMGLAPYRNSLPKLFPLGRCFGGKLDCLTCVTSHLGARAHTPVSDSLHGLTLPCFSHSCRCTGSHFCVSYIHFAEQAHTSVSQFRFDSQAQTSVFLNVDSSDRRTLLCCSISFLSTGANYRVSLSQINFAYLFRVSGSLCFAQLTKHG